MKVDILMATYNGGSYLKNQLLSLQMQTHQNWRLLVRDDGSTDETLSILKDFSNADDRICIIDHDSGKKLGAGSNFLGLTQFVDSDYIIFCDQDDIWFEKKLEFLIENAKENFIYDKPCLVYCDGYGYSDSLGVITNNSISRLHAENLRDFIFFNAGYQGCSILFNKNLCSYVSKYRADFHLHDDIVSLVAHTFGKVFFVNKKLMLYRQHGLNVTGNIEYSITKKIKKFVFDRGFVISARHFLEKKQFYDFYYDILSDTNKKTFEYYFSFPNLNLFKRFFLIFSKKFTFGGSLFYLLCKTAFQRPIE